MRNAHKAWLFVLSAMIVPVCLAACSSRPAPVPVQESGSVAVSAFTQPRMTSDLLAGYIPDGSQVVEPKVLYALDDRLLQLLQKGTTRSLIMPAVTRQCEEIVTHKSDKEHLSTFNYWESVGACVPAQFIIVPQLIFWREREGGEWGATSPASVILDLFLIDVKNKQLIRRYHFDETQQPLSSNILKADQFFSRGGKFLTAQQLAEEALAQGVKELGL